MRNPASRFRAAVVACFAAALAWHPASWTWSLARQAMAQQAEREQGLLADQADIGTVSHAGSATYDPASRVYSVTGGGANMWFAHDDFHFAWKKVSSDVTLAADIAFVGSGKNPHRKACLIIRQGLEPDAAYVDVAVHGDGLTSLQFRDTKGGATHEVQTDDSRPRRVQLVQRGQNILLFVAQSDGPWKFSGAAVRMTFSGPRYAGIGVCGHDDSITETANFSHLAIEETAKPSADKPTLYSTLETQSLASTDRRVVHVTQGRIEAPNWLRDGKTLIYNSGGRIYRIPAAGGQPELLDTGFAKRCNNDHGVSPDGTRLVISDQSQPDGKSRIYSLPVNGGEPTLITPQGPSYWHGWSPDGKTLAYCAERNGEFDVYKIAATGGPEQRLTTAKGLDDGPEFSPDGNLIYFNSDRTGRMQIWRMKPDGTDQQQITNDSLNNWFPHPSPDGRFLVFLSYEQEVTGHPENKDVTLRRMTLSSRKIDVLGKFLGGQGTINVPCWSPDGRQISFVTYQRISTDSNAGFSNFVGLEDFSGFTRSQSVDGQTILLSPEIKSHIPWNELIVSWNAEAPTGSFVKIEASAHLSNHQTRFYVLGNWSPDGKSFPRTSVRGPKNPDGDVNTDTLILNQTANSTQIRVTLGGTNGAMPKLRFLGLSFSDTKVPPANRPPNHAAWGKIISTPEHSQYAYPNGKGWCSPTSLSMTLARWADVLHRPELDLTVPEVAAAVYDADYGGTGNWPFNAAFAGSFQGMRSYVTRFDDLSEVEDWIVAGIPVILSARFDLLQPGRPLDTAGHLVVCIGFTESGDVVINDPATRLEKGEQVRHVYKRENVLRAWAKSHDTVYLVYPESARIPKDRFGHWQAY